MHVGEKGKEMMMIEIKKSEKMKNIIVLLMIVMKIYAFDNLT